MILVPEVPMLTIDLLAERADPAVLLYLLVVKEHMVTKCILFVKRTHLSWSELFFIKCLVNY